MLLAGTIAMEQTAFEHVRHDFHIAMGMRAEALARRDTVVVEDSQNPKAHVLRIVVVRE